MEWHVRHYSLAAKYGQLIRFNPMEGSLENMGFDYSEIPEGYYHTIFENGSRVRKAWHVHKFDRILDCLPRGKGLSLLDIGCFAGTFLSILPESWFSRQVGVDILEKQIAFAKKHFGTPYRDFYYLRNTAQLSEMAETFDCITLIEVIEHLTEPQIVSLFEQIHAKLKPGGHLVLSTPNYHSAWPLIEILVNRLSEVTYEEQHLTKFGYFNVARKLNRLLSLDRDWTIEFKTTTHFVSPFLAAVSPSAARGVARLVPHAKWHLPFGSLLLLRLKRK